MPWKPLNEKCISLAHICYILDKTSHEIMVSKMQKANTTDNGLSQRMQKKTCTEAAEQN